MNCTSSDCLTTGMAGRSTSLPGQKVSRNDNKQGRLLLAELVTQPAPSCPLLWMFLKLREPDGSDCTSLLLVAVSPKSFPVLCPWPSEGTEMSFILCKTAAAIVLAPRHCVGGWLWRMPGRKGHLDRSAGRLFYFQASHGPQAVN